MSASPQRTREGAMRLCVGLLVGSLTLLGSFASAADYDYTPRWPNVRTYSPEWPNTASQQVSYTRDGWGGFHLGWNAGVGFAHGTASIGLGGAQYSASQDLFGAVGGVQAGYDWQFGHLVWGLEGDIDASGQSREIDFCPGCAVTATLKNEVQWFSTFRGRAGYAFHGALFYATGGVAAVGVKSTLTASGFGLTGELGNWSATRPAWTVGGGIGFKVMDGWEAHVEYLYFDTGKFDANISTFLGVYTPTVQVQDQLIRVGMDYRF